MTVIIAIVVNLSIMGGNALSNQLQPSPPVIEQAKQEKLVWVPERVPDNTYLNVRPSAPMGGAGYR